MNALISRKLHNFEIINDICLRGEILIFGASSMEDFPLYEFINKISFDHAVYNRSIRGMTVEDALEIADIAVIPLKPCKIFLALGEEDALDRHTLHQYQELIEHLTQALPKAQIYALPVALNKEGCGQFNADLQQLCEKENVVFIDIYISPENYRESFKKLCSYFLSSPITMTDAFQIASI